MSHEILVRKIEQGQLSPVYFIYGPDEFPQQEVIKALKAKIATGPMAQFNLDELSGQSLSWAALIERAQTLPMMASHRLVIGWNVERLLKKSDDDLRAAETYVANPLPETVLVLTARDIDKRLRFFKALSTGKAVLFEGKHPQPSEVPQYIKRFAEGFGKLIDREAARLLGDLVGTETMWIRNEVDKLCLYVGDRKEIRVEDVQTLMADIGAHQVWDLTDALAARDFPLCIRLLEALLRDNEAPPLIFGALARQMRMIAQVKILQGARYNRDAIVKAIPIRFGADKLFGYARAFSEGEMAHIYRRMNATDLSLKRSSQPPRMVLEAFLADICLQGPGAFQSRR
jgi:DNA polymerase III subunit delta